MIKKRATVLLISLFAFMLSSFQQSALFKPDISYAGIKLLDRQSVLSILGDIHQYQIDDSIYPFRGYIFIDDSAGQYIRLVHYPGDGYDSFAWIEIAYTRYLPKGKFAQHKRLKNFFSESGIAPGISVDRLLKIKGTPLSITKESNLTVYTYKLTGIDSSAFLSKYNMPEYNAIFYFENKTLVKYEFGFVYP